MGKTQQSGADQGPLDPRTLSDLNREHGEFEDEVPEIEAGVWYRRTTDISRDRRLTTSEAGGKFKLSRGGRSAAMGIPVIILAVAVARAFGWM